VLIVVADGDGGNLSVAVVGKLEQDV
jgi:hypothetical protein